MTTGSLDIKDNVAFKPLSHGKAIQPQTLSFVADRLAGKQDCATGREAAAPGQEKQQKDLVFDCVKWRHAG